MQSLHPLTPSQLGEFLLHVATVRPVFIWGAPEDLIGVPQIERGVSRFCSPTIGVLPELS